MTVVTYHQGTVEHVRVEWTADVTLSAQPVEIAIHPATRPVADGDWQNAAWTGDPGATRIAQILVNFTGKTLGLWNVRSRLTDNPEIPEKHAGQFRVVR